MMDGRYRFCTHIIRTVGDAELKPNREDKRPESIKYIYGRKNPHARECVMHEIDREVSLRIRQKEAHGQRVCPVHKPAHLMRRILSDQREKHC